MSEHLRYADDEAPDLIGKYGRAWRTDTAAIARRYPGGPPADLTVASWLVRAPYAHPVWHSYMIGAVSLRDLEGAPPAVIHLQAWIRRFSASNIKGDPRTSGMTTVIVEGEQATIIGSGKTAAEVITGIAAGPTPPKGEQH